jgi:hypothetical protein
VGGHTRPRYPAPLGRHAPPPRHAGPAAGSVLPRLPVSTNPAARGTRSCAGGRLDLDDGRRLRVTTPYLIGSECQPKPAWNAYYAAPQISGRRRAPTRRASGSSTAPTLADQVLGRGACLGGRPGPRLRLLLAEPAPLRARPPKGKAGAPGNEPGSITSIPRRCPVAAPFSAIQLRLIRRVEPFSGTRTKVQTQ